MLSANASAPQSPLTRLSMMTGLAALALLLPTVAFLQLCGGDNAACSRQISDAWHSGLWHYVQQIGMHLPQKTVSLLADALTWIAAGVFLLGYGATYNAFTARQIIFPVKAFLGQLVLVCLLLAGVIPFHSRDVYGYVNRGAQQLFYAVNPYLTPVGEMPNWQLDSIFQNHWVDNPCPYGFFYAQWAKFLTFWGQHHFFQTFLIFKLSAAGFHLVNTWLVYQITRRLNRPHAAWAMFLYGFSPLILLNQIANGHNDGILACFLLMAFAALFSDNAKFLTWPAALLSVLTKYASLLAMPFMLIYAIRQKQWRPLVMGAVISLGMLVFLAWPYLQDWQILPWDRMVENAGKSQHSIQAALARLLSYTVGNFAPNKAIFLEDTRLILKKLFFYAFVLFYAFRIFKFWKISNPAYIQRIHAENQQVENPLVSQESIASVSASQAHLDIPAQTSLSDVEVTAKSRDAMLYEIALTMSVYLVIASAKFHAWYLGMVLPFVLLLNPEQRSHRRLMLVMLTISVFQLLAFTPLENIHIVGPLLLIILPATLALTSKPNPFNTLRL